MPMSHQRTSDETAPNITVLSTVDVQERHNDGEGHEWVEQVQTLYLMSDGTVRWWVEP